MSKEQLQTGSVYMGLLLLRVRLEFSLLHFLRRNHSEQRLLEMHHLQGEASELKQENAGDETLPNVPPETEVKNLK
jgi:hypothetical protein